ncbi:MAG: DedA family protein [Armatimonadetes bacterium]|nr:DedA family protein [Armatimonadota bacterium]NIM23062.1 DedA family protein [Armatimonadota bacterium]NIM66930.1 DedA family protein [Armatimonadota bacterium]NIM75464.1 DedA family protein [Armatimonadota bacterium]NIN05121.1 DedA family protein [Armatimonadota bacterium]
MNDWVEIIVEAITGFIGSAGYVGVFLLMVMESCCMPIPSEIVLVSAGFLVGRGDFALHWAMLSGFAGALSGSTLTYSIARFGGRPLLLRYGRYILLTEQRLRASEKWFARHGPKAVFFCRLISGMRAIVSVPAGLCHMPYSKFLLYTALGSGSWVVVGVLFGMFVGREWEKLSHLGHLALAAAALVVAALLIWHHLRSRCVENSSSEPCPARGENPSAQSEEKAP